MTVEQLLALKEGSLIRSDRAAGDNVDVQVGGELVGTAELIVLGGSLGVSYRRFPREVLGFIRTISVKRLCESSRPPIFMDFVQQFAGVILVFALLGALVWFAQGTQLCSSGSVSSGLEGWRSSNGSRLAPTIPCISSTSTVGHSSSEFRRTAARCSRT